MDPDEGLSGNGYSGTAFFAAENVPSRHSPITDATVANAYATLALAQEQRASTLATLVESSDRGIAERARDELLEMLGWSG